MKIHFSLPQSISNRITFSSLAIMLLSIWTLTFFVGSTVQEDMRSSLAEQQLSTVSVLAAEIDHQVALRFKAIQVMATKITPTMLDSPVLLQTSLDSFPVLNVIFNSGVFITDANGIVQASVPSSIVRIGLSYSDREYFIDAMQGKASISRPFIDNVRNVQVLVVAMPIRNGQGKTIGVVGGLIDFSKSSFLDVISSHAYGKTGGYILISPQHNRIVTATNMQALMNETANSFLLMSRFKHSYQGSGVVLNSLGVEMLSSAIAIPSAGWLLMADLPTAEAFAPIRAMQRRTLFFTFLLSVFASGLIYWLTKHQLTPMLETSKTLTRLSREGGFPHALPVAKNDELGALIGSFNRLLQTLVERENTLRLSEENLAITLQSIGDAVIATDATGVITRMNSAAERLTGCMRSDAIGRPLVDVFRIIDTEQGAASVNPVQMVMEQGNLGGSVNHAVLLAHDGNAHQITDSAAPIRDSSGQIVGVVLVFSDVTEKYKAQAALQHAQRRFRDLVDSTDGIVWEADAITFNFMSVSRNAERMLGFSTEEWLVPGFWASRIYADDREFTVNYSASRTACLEDHDFEYRFVAQDGRVVWVRDIVKIVALDGKPRWLRGLMLDITAQKYQQETLQKTLREKTSLLNEVHHRVKNNLQVITSLLRLEVGRSDQAGVKSVLIDMQGRIRAMSLLHETLYRSGIFASADLAHYLRELAVQAFRAQASNSSAVELKLDLASVTVSMDQATPCGLMVNELLSNCLKHGFPDGYKGVVTLMLKLIEGGERAQLSVSDNGIGLPADFENKYETSLGLHLASDLAKQIGGELIIKKTPQLAFEITFTIKKTLHDH